VAEVATADTKQGSEAEAEAVPVAEVAAADTKQVPEVEAESAPVVEVTTADTEQVLDTKAPKVTVSEVKKPHRSDKPRTETRRRPVDRGGRPRKLEGQDSVERSGGHNLSEPRAELVCWKSGLVWILGVEISPDPDTPTVVQSDEPIVSDMRNPSLYPIRYVGSTVTVCWDDTEKHISVGDPNRNPFIFKMGKDWTGIGRLVTHPTYGHYIAVAPQSWDRDEGLAGPPPIMPEPVRPDGGVAHYFYENSDEPKAIGFILEDGRRVQVEALRARYELVGRRILDYSEDVGPLMAAIPRIKARRANGWGDVSTIVIGREGKGRKRWRMQFVPEGTIAEQCIPLDAREQHHGWYFLRIYNRDACLLDSMDFRFAPGLSDIRVEGDACLPGPNGHEQTTVQFIHQNGCAIQPVDPTVATALEVRRENGHTVATIPARPDLDETHWIIRDHGAEVYVIVLVKRIWWGIGTISDDPLNWTDKPLTISCKNFTATTDGALYIRLPHRRFTDHVEVGFDSSRRRPYPIPVEEREIAIPLCEFCDEWEVSSSLGSNLLYTFVSFDEGLHSVPVLEVTAKVKCKMDGCEFTTTSWSKARAHVVEHESTLIPHLPYEELARRSAGLLPRHIYKCPYCPFYATTDSLDSPTSTITTHIASKHPDEQIGFRIVGDVDEIRRNIIANLPIIYRCRYKTCLEEFSGDNRGQRLSHLWKKHRNDLFEIR